MGEEREPRQRRATTHFKFYSEKYLWGSTKTELKPDERAVWIDFLCLASMNFGVIEIYSRHQLARQLMISRKLLDRSIEKFLKFKKIEKKCEVDAQCGVSEEKGDIFIIAKWDYFQARYLTKRVEKSTTYEKPERIVKTGLRDSQFCPTLQETTLHNTTLQRESKSKESDINIKSEEDYIESKEIPIENPPSSESKNFTDGKKAILQEYLAKLGACPGYSLDDYKDGAQFHYVWDNYPGIDILKELDKKIAWWKKNPEALERTASPRQKLCEWFEKEWEFQNKGEHE